MSTKAIDDPEIMGFIDALIKDNDELMANFEMLKTMHERSHLEPTGDESLHIHQLSDQSVSLVDPTPILEATARLEAEAMPQLARLRDKVASAEAAAAAAAPPEVRRQLLSAITAAETRRESARSRLTILQERVAALRSDISSVDAAAAAVPEPESEDRSVTDARNRLAELVDQLATLTARTSAEEAAAAAAAERARRAQAQQQNRAAQSTATARRELEDARASLERESGELRALEVSARAAERRAAAAARAAATLAGDLEGASRALQQIRQTSESLEATAPTSVRDIDAALEADVARGEAELAGLRARMREVREGVRACENRRMAASQARSRAEAATAAHQRTLRELQPAVQMSRTIVLPNCADLEHEMQLALQALEEADLEIGRVGCAAETAEKRMRRLQRMIDAKICNIENEIVAESSCLSMGQL